MFPVPGCSSLALLDPGLISGIPPDEEEDLIEQARAAARAQKTTLNQLFRNWLGELAGRREQDEKLAALLNRLDYVKSGGPFTREEMNER